MNSRIGITIFLILALVYAAQASCPSTADQIASQLQTIQTNIATACADATQAIICDASSACRIAIHDVFAFAEDCAAQIEGSNTAAVLQAYLDAEKAFITAACGTNPEDLASLYFNSCTNVDKILAAIKTYVPLSHPFFLFSCQ